MRILLAEDDAPLARVVAGGLRDGAYAVDVAGDGEEALVQALVEHEPLTDEERAELRRLIDTL